MVLAVIGFIWWFMIFGGLGCYIAFQCGRHPVEGWFLGGVLGPIGLFLLVLLPRQRCEPPPARQAAVSRKVDEGELSDFLTTLK